MWTTLALLGGVIFLLYKLITRYINGNEDYWPKRGVLLVKGTEIGSLWQLLTKKISILAFDEGYYRIIKAKASDRGYGGIMELRNPVLYLTDLDLVKKVLVKDFDHFVDRRDAKFNEPVFDEMVVMLEGQKWKDVRSVLSPAFSTGRIKRMFEHFNACGQKLVKCIERKEGGVVLVPEMVGRFTTDVVGATAFGMDTGALGENGDQSHFYKMAQKISAVSGWRIFKNALFLVLPKLAQFLRLRIFPADAMDFFIGVLAEALKQREAKDAQVRNDFLQLLVEARRGELKGEEGEKPAVGVDPHSLFTDNLTMAQSFVFFIAGFDTVASLVGMGAYLMALNPEMQKKIYEEVKGNVDESGDIDYDAVNKLHYTDMFISEILRRYPPANRLERKCIHEYKLDEHLTVPKDMLVAISIQGTHMDPDLWPDPLVFDPERFTPENKANRHPFAYIPFGQGPRICIGMRFALMESKLALAYLAYHFKIEPTEKTPIPLAIDAAVGLNRPIATLELKFTPRKV